MYAFEIISESILDNFLKPLEIGIFNLYFDVCFMMLLNPALRYDAQTDYERLVCVKMLEDQRKNIFLALQSVLTRLMTDYITSDDIRYIVPYLMRISFLAKNKHRRAIVKHILDIMQARSGDESLQWIKQSILDTTHITFNNSN